MGSRDIAGIRVALCLHLLYIWYCRAKNFNYLQFPNILQFLNTLPVVELLLFQASSYAHGKAVPKGPILSL